MSGINNRIESDEEWRVISLAITIWQVTLLDLLIKPILEQLLVAFPLRVGQQEAGTPGRTRTCGLRFRKPPPPGPGNPRDSASRSL